MSQLPFTQRELKNAWRQLRQVSISTPRSNAHRLLLFYSIECGLKAAWLKNKGKNLFESEDISQTGHNLNQLLKDLRIKQTLPIGLSMGPVQDHRRNPIPRNGDIDVLHQVWRYGGALMNPPVSDSEMEQSLEKIQAWIEKELT